jgi:hypothetical protein
MLPLQQSYDVPNNFYIWQQDDDIITEVFQAPKDDLVQCSLDNFRSYLEVFDEYFFEHLDLFYEEDYQPSLCSNFDKEDVASLKQDTWDKVVQLPLIALPRYVTKDAVGEHVSCFKFSLGKKISLEFKGTLNALRTLLSQYFSFPLRSCQFPSKFLLIPSQTPGSDDIQGNQPSDSLSHPFESLTSHDPFLRWIDHLYGRVAWHDFVPPSHLHELGFTISYDIMHALTHVYFVLNLSLFWFMMKHTSRCYDTLLAWLYWLYAYS